MDQINDKEFHETHMPEERAEIVSWLKNVRFRRKLFGGVDERTVWRKISELDALYTKALEAERVRYDSQLEAYRSSVNEELRRLKAIYGGEG